MTDLKKNNVVQFGVFSVVFCLGLFPAQPLLVASVMGSVAVLRLSVGPSNYTTTSCYMLPLTTDMQHGSLVGLSFVPGSELRPLFGKGCWLAKRPPEAFRFKNY